MNAQDDPDRQAMDQRWALTDAVYEVLKCGDEGALARLQAEHPEFPHGRDWALDRHWLTNAIHLKAVRAIGWLIEQGVDLSYRDEEGLTPLCEALDCDDEQTRYDLLRLLLAHGARADIIGANFFTVAHWAAMRNDVVALRILKKHGADLCVATDDYGWSTPADIAKSGRCHEALDYLEEVCQGKARKLYPRQG